VAPTTLTATLHSWQTPDGQSFAYSRWAPVSSSETAEPRAVVLAVHGLSGAALDFEPLGRHLAGHGIVTLAIELRGQGNDPRPARRGDLERLDDWFADLHAFVALVRRLHPEVPVFFYGESMGAALLTRFLAQAGPEDQPAGLVLASPVVALPRRPAWWQEALFRFLLLAWPTLRINVGKLAKPRTNPPPRVTRDDEHRRWFETADHRLVRFTLRFFKCLFELVDGCSAAAPRVRVPVLVVYAAQDIFIPPAKVEEFFARLGSREKELGFFPEAYHLLLHDHDRAQVLARIESWLLRRLGHSACQPDDMEYKS
jgi:alpha-beta hydrolase superfamily lysophospholipase